MQTSEPGGSSSLGPGALVPVSPFFQRSCLCTGETPKELAVQEEILSYLLVKDTNRAGDGALETESLVVEVEPESCLGTDMIEAVEGHLQGKEKKGDKYIKRGDLDMKIHGER